MSRSDMSDLEWEFIKCVLPNKFRGVKRVDDRRVLNGMLGFAAGVMIAASFWSLLAPAIEMAGEMDIPDWVPATVGFLLGGAFIRLIDMVLPHLHLGFPTEEAEGVPTTWRRSVLLILAITLHNFPEGLAVGVAFGAAAAGVPSATVTGAAALALGIGIQNFPEGTAVSVPLRREGMSRLKSCCLRASEALPCSVSIISGVASMNLVCIPNGIPSRCSCCRTS